MLLEYDAEKKQLIISAAIEFEHFELEAYAGIMRHGDICTLNHIWGKTDRRCHIIYFDGGFERMQNIPLTMHLSPDSLGYLNNLHALASFWANIEESETVVAQKFANLTYLWAGETASGGWNTLVLGHQ